MALNLREFLRNPDHVFQILSAFRFDFSKPYSIGIAKGPDGPEYVITITETYPNELSRKIVILNGYEVPINIIVGTPVIDGINSF